MTDPIRVLVVDDSVVARRFITNRLEQDDEIDVIGTARSGESALRKIRTDPPDAVVLDEEMPDLRGRDVLKVIRKEQPHIAVVMFSGHVGHGTQARFEALLFGADDAVSKPSASGGPISDDHPTWTELLTKTKRAARRPDRGGAPAGVARRHATTDRASAAKRRSDGGPGGSRTERGSSAQAGESGTGAPTAQDEPSPRRARRLPATSDPGVVVIASSTGGPDALTTLFSQLPGDFPLPILIAQHMPPHFTALLARRLDKHSALHVVEASGGEVLEPGTVLVAPGDEHLLVRSHPVQCRAGLDLGPPENSCRPAADVLFRSAAEAFGHRVVACVISGMGQDGMLGATQVHEAGGVVVAQDEATSVVWGMPGAVVAAGIADEVLPLEEIAGALTRAARTVERRASRREAVR